MTDINKLYVLISTGTIWAYKNVTSSGETTITNHIVGTSDNPYEIGRLSSSGTVSTDVSTYIVTPYIDLTKTEYQGKTIQIHLEGNRYASETVEVYIMSALYDANKNVILARGYTTLESGNTFNPSCIQINSATSSIITITIPHTYNSKAVGFVRFCGLGEESTSNVYITYLETSTSSTSKWIDTGTFYSLALTEEGKSEIAEQAAHIVDTQLLPLIGDGEVSV